MQMTAADSLHRVQVPSFDAVSTQAWMRLVKAVALSFLLHLALLVGLPVNPTGGDPQRLSTITARLEPVAAQSEPLRADPAAVDPIAPTPPVEKAPKPAEARPEKKVEPASAKESAPSPSTGIEVPFIRDPTYYPAKQLDVYPQPLNQIKLDYPDSAASAKVDGRVLVLLLIDEF